MQETISRRFPPITECQMFHETYGDDLEAYALADWRRNFELQQQGKKVRYAGHL